jgi:predicted Zn finger-like uncharacterized protein
MPTIVACPSCGGKLRVTDALYGQRVRCPACQHIFDGPAEHAPQDLPLDLTIDDPSSPPPPTGDTVGLVGAIELKTPSEGPPASPEPEAPAEPPRRPRHTEERLDPDEPDLRRWGPRRDAEPDRGAVVLALGVISLSIVLVWCAAPLGIILGLAAWIMGQTDLRKMKSGQMDDAGRGATQAGWICGILGTVLNGLLTLGCGAFIGAIWYSELSRPPLTKPVPVTAKMLPKAPPQPNKAAVPQPKKRPEKKP